jgi:hypothetical protein
MRGSRQGGYVMLVVLGFSVVLFLLLNLAITANYRLHRQNVRLSAELQARASALVANPR